jgi:hypothetical protein
MILAVLLLAAATSRVLLMDEIVEVPPSGLRAVDVSLRQRPAVVECSFTVLSRTSGVRVALMTAAEARRFQHGRAHEVLRATPFQRSGSFRQPVSERGDYRIVIDNRMEGRGPARVQLHVSLVFGDGSVAAPQTLSMGRRFLVVCLSLLFFVGVTVWVGRRVRLAIERRNRGAPLPPLY